MSTNQAADAISFKGVHPVCPVLDMSVHLAFRRRLGFEVAFSGGRPPDSADYVGIARGGIELHLQTFAADDLKRTQIMATRIELTDAGSLESLHAEWTGKVDISAPLRDTAWGTREFGFHDPARSPFFFYVDRT
jgi:hypothetical protein